MSRKDEDRILHGLHYYLESIDEEFTATSEQILWLAAHSYTEGANWCKDGRLQSLDSRVVPDELRGKLMLAKFELPLRYLQYRRLIKLAAINDDSVDLAVTFAGADRAMRLHTPLGRVEVWYQEKKDGFLGLMVTVCVAFLAGLIAAGVAERLHERNAEPPRIIYEMAPRP